MRTILADKIENSISSLERTSYQVKELIDTLRAQGSVYLIGGAIRDIIHNSPPKDYDFVVDTYKGELNIPEDKFESQRNRFNGYKLTISSIKFDVWALKDTWAFKGRVGGSSKDDLQQSCFFDIDSAIFDLDEKKLYMKNFENGMEMRILDIIHVENSNPDYCVAKAFLLRQKFNMTFSNELKRYIRAWSQYNPIQAIQKIEDVQALHYKRILLNSYEVSKELSYITRF